MWLYYSTKSNETMPDPELQKRLNQSLKGMMQILQMNFSALRAIQQGKLCFAKKLIARLDKKDTTNIFQGKRRSVS